MAEKNGDKSTFRVSSRDRRLAEVHRHILRFLMPDITLWVGGIIENWKPEAACPIGWSNSDGVKPLVMFAAKLLLPPPPRSNRKKGPVPVE